MKRIKHKFRKGAASFYVVAFSTLILVVVATSFAMVVVAEVQRASNDDLSQSAYDSALAGVEDAKLAYSNYRRCIANGSNAEVPNGDGVTSCSEIVWWMEHPDCDMVGHMVGRLKDSGTGEVAIDETASGTVNTESDTNQAYTCVQIRTKLEDYRATLNESNRVKVVKVEFKNIGDNNEKISANDIKGIELSWYTNSKDTKYQFSNMQVSNGLGRVTFQPVKSMPVAAPPTLEFQLIQTAEQFTLDKLLGASTHGGSSTDRATMFFAPTDDEAAAGSSGNPKNYRGIYNNKVNKLSAIDIAKTNDHYISNVPYGTYCGDKDTEFACTVQMVLPSPIGENGSFVRNDDTFMFVVSLPYGEPETDFSLRFFTDDGFTDFVQVDGAQVVIDSTGRANDLYRRVEVRLETSDTSFPYPYYAIQLLGDGDKTLLNKNLTVTSECNYYDGDGSNC